jgi:hypothetical protein
VSAGRGKARSHTREMFFQGRQGGKEVDKGRRQGESRRSEAKKSTEGYEKGSEVSRTEVWVPERRVHVRGPGL